MAILPHVLGVLFLVLLQYMQSYCTNLFCMKRGALMMSEDKPVQYSLFLCEWLWLLSGAETNMDPHNNLLVAEIV